MGYKKNDVSKKVMARVDIDLWNELREYAEKNGMKMYAVVNESIKQFLDRENGKD